MRTLHLESFPFGREQGFSSVEEAMASIGANPRQNRAQREGQALADACLTGYEFDRTHVNMWFSNAWALSIRVGTKNLYWRVGPRDALVRTEPDDLGERCRRQLRDGESTVWERRAPFESRLGGTVHMLDAGTIQVRLYLHKHLILCFDPMRDLDTGDLLLYWWEDD
jgi:hypothetical protein